MNKSTNEVIFVGHGIGGAMAIMAAYAVSDYIRPKVFTFGSPRPGDEAFAKLVEEKVDLFRIVNYGDEFPYDPDTPDYVNPG